MADFTSKLKPAEPSGETSLKNERSRSSFSAAGLSNHLFAADGFLERQDKVLKEMLKHKVFSKKTQLNMSRPDRYKLALARSKTLVRLKMEKGWSTQDYLMGEYLVDEMAPYTLQIGMFRTTVAEQGSEEQRNHYLPLIDRWKIYGSYAQTELGHGSNVRGLEATATYDTKTKEFIIHSPTLTSSKWWNGSLGRTATHAIVVAQLMLPKDPKNPSNGLVSYGPHPLIVRVRDEKTHQPLKGIVVGDIGPKYGYPGMDNAYMLFDNHRVPHSAFLNRYSNVDKDTGAYTKPENPAVVYGSLTATRTVIIMNARMILARAVTIAVRYLCIRRQFRDRDDGSSSEPEMVTLDYPTVQIRVLPLLAQAFALHYSGVAMGELHRRTRGQIEKGDFSALADLHATSSGLKSLCTTYAADGIEIARRAMGGHGFGGGSGLIGVNNEYLSKPTVEGDNWMITQQTASYLIKKASKVSQAKADFKPADDTEAALQNYFKAKQSGGLNGQNAFEFLSSFTETDSKPTSADKALVQAFERRAADMAVKVYEAREVRKQKWNSLLIELHNLSNAHSQAILVRNFHNGLAPDAENAAPAPPDAVRPLLLALFRLYSLHTIQAHSLQFLNAGAVSLSTLNGISDGILALMRQVRPHAVSIVDSFAIPDYLLDSALGRSDGKVYEDLFERAHKLNPLNKETFNPYYWREEIIHGGGDGGLKGKL